MQSSNSPRVPCTSSFCLFIPAFDFCGAYYFWIWNIQKLLLPMQFEFSDGYFLCSHPAPPCIPSSGLSAPHSLEASILLP